MLFAAAVVVCCGVLVAVSEGVSATAQRPRASNEQRAKQLLQQHDLAAWRQQRSKAAARAASARTLRANVSSGTPNVTPPSPGGSGDEAHSAETSAAFFMTSE